MASVIENNKQNGKTRWNYGEKIMKTMKITIFCLAVVFTVMSPSAYAEENEEKPRLRDKAAEVGKKAVGATVDCLTNPAACYEKGKKKGIEIKDKVLEAKNKALEVKRKADMVSEILGGTVKTPSKWILCTNWKDQFAFVSLFLFFLYWFTRKQVTPEKAIGMGVLSFFLSRGLILLNELFEKVWMSDPANPEAVVQAGTPVVTVYAESVIPYVITWLPLVFPLILFIKRRWILEAVSAVKHEGFKGFKNHLTHKIGEARTNWVKCVKPDCDCTNPLGYNFCQRCRTFSPNADLSNLPKSKPKDGGIGGPPSIADDPAWNL